MKKNVLDKGFVEVVGVLGNDLTVVNSARVSFGKRKDALEDEDIKLINYLVKHKHFSPLRHIMVQFHLKAPEVCMRQLYKHVVGIEGTSSYPTKDHAWNEISRRYVEIDDFYYPDIWRLQSASNKQASQLDNDGNPIIEEDVQTYATEQYDNCIKIINRTIKDLISKGIAKEQAQMLFPISFYTEVYWTASFQAIANLIELRDDNHAQWETRQYAIAIKELVRDLFPVTMGAWFDG